MWHLLKGSWPSLHTWPLTDSLPQNLHPLTWKHPTGSQPWNLYSGGYSQFLFLEIDTRVYMFMCEPIADAFWERPRNSFQYILSQHELSLPIAFLGCADLGPLWRRNGQTLLPVNSPIPPNVALTSCYLCRDLDSSQLSPKTSQNMLRISKYPMKCGCRKAYLELSQSPLGNKSTVCLSNRQPNLGKVLREHKIYNT